MKLLALAGLALAMVACGGASVSGVDTSLTGHWCAVLGGSRVYEVSAMTLTEHGNAVDGRAFDDFSGRSDSSVVVGTISGSTVSLTFSNFEGTGPKTLMGPLPNPNSVAIPPGDLDLTIPGTTTGADWSRQPDNMISQGACAGLYP